MSITRLCQYAKEFEMKKALCLVAILLLPVLVFAETIELKSGKIVEGKILDKQNDLIEVDVGGGVVVKYYVDDLLFPEKLGFSSSKQKQVSETGFVEESTFSPEILEEEGGIIGEDEKTESPFEILEEEEVVVAGDEAAEASAEIVEEGEETIDEEENLEDIPEMLEEEEVVVAGDEEAESPVEIVAGEEEIIGEEENLEDIPEMLEEEEVVVSEEEAEAPAEIVAGRGRNYWGRGDFRRYS